MKSFPGVGLDGSYKGWKRTKAAPWTKNEYREKVNGRECNLHVTPGPYVCRECVQQQIKRLGIMHKKEKKTRSKTPTFLLELPLSADAGQARSMRAHFEAARCLYNARLREATSRLRRMRADPQWQEARAIPRTQKPERSSAFARLRHAYGFSAYALHTFAKQANRTWIADHLDAVTAQTLATRAYRAANRVCLGQAKHVRFRSRGRGLDSLEGKRNDTGLRFMLQSPQEGNQGWLLWGNDRIPAIIDWHDPVVKYGLSHRIKYARLLRRNASGPKAQGADSQGERYYVQLALEGLPYQKLKNGSGTEVVGLDVGPSIIAIVPRTGVAVLSEKEVHMDRKEERDIMRRGSLSEGEMQRLSHLRRVHRERIKLMELEHHRRLEFVRWLVDTGKLTDQTAS